MFMFGGMAGEGISSSNDSELPSVAAEEIAPNEINPDFWYGEEDVILVLYGYLKGLNLHLYNAKQAKKAKQGFVQTASDKLYRNKDFSFSLGYDLASTEYHFQTAAQGELLKSAIAELIDWNAAAAESGSEDNIIVKHKFLIPLNFGDSHWNTLEVAITFVKIDSKFYLDTAIVANVYESMPLAGLKDITSVHRFLGSYFEKFTYNNAPFNFTGERINCKRQSDTKSCGPITVNNIWLLLNGEPIETDHARYSHKDTIDLRKAHVAAVKNLDDPNDAEKTSEKFTSKQMQNLVRTADLEVSTNGQVEVISAALYKYIVSEESKLNKEQQNDLFSAFNDYHAADAQSSQLAMMDNADENEKLSKEIYAKEAKNTKIIKDWFLANYEALHALNIIQNIFAACDVRNPPTELSWCDRGRDTLIALIPCLMYERAYANAKSKPRFLPYFESSGDGKLRQTRIQGEVLPGIGFALAFEGLVTEADLLYKGKVVALIGQRMHQADGKQLVYMGMLINGEMQSSGKIYILDKSSKYLGFVEGIFSEGALTQVTKTTVQDYNFVVGICAHTRKYRHEFNFKRQLLEEDSGFELIDAKDLAGAEDLPVFYSKVPQIGLDTYFKGEPLDMNNKPVNGLINCLVGGKIKNKYYVSYRGAIQDGTFHGYGTLTLFTPDHKQYSIKVVADEAGNLECLEHNIPDVHEEEYFMLMMAHINTNKRNFVFNLEPNQLANIKIKLKL